MTLLTLGIGGIYPLYRLTADPYKHDKRENRVVSRINNILLDLKLIDKPMSFKEKQFVTGCVTLEVLSPKQIIWVRSLGLRFSMC